METSNLNTEPSTVVYTVVDSFELNNQLRWCHARFGPLKYRRGLLSPRRGARG